MKGVMDRESCEVVCGRLVHCTDAYLLGLQYYLWCLPR